MNNIKIGNKTTFNLKDCFTNFQVFITKTLLSGKLYIVFKSNNSNLSLPIGYICHLEKSIYPKKINMKHYSLLLIEDKDLKIRDYAVLYNRLKKEGVPI